MMRLSVVLAITSDFLFRPVLPFSRALKWFCPEARLMIFPVRVFLYRLSVAWCVFSFIFIKVSVPMRRITFLQ